MLESLVIVVEALGQMPWKQPTGRLHDAIGQVVRYELEASAESIESALQREHRRQPGGAQVLNGEEGILAVLFRDREGVTVHVLALDRQRLEVAEDVTADPREIVGIVGPDVEVRYARFLWEGIGAPREQHHFPRAPRRFKQAFRVRIEPGGRRGLDVTNMLLVVVIGTEAIRVVLDVRGAEVTLLEPVENSLRIVAEPDSEVIDEMHGAALVA